MSPEIEPSGANRTSSTTLSSISSRTRIDIVDITKKLYHQDYEMFLLNNLVMAVVPFENYEEDLKVLSKNSPREKDIDILNKKFEKDYKKSLIFPDTFFENVNKRVAFQRRGDTYATSLMPERVFIVDSSMEVYEGDKYDSSNDDLNDPSFKLKLIPSERIGFVLLQNRLWRKSSMSSIASWASNELSPPRSERSTISYGEIDLARTKEPLGNLDPDLRYRRKSSLFKLKRNEHYYRSSIITSQHEPDERTFKHDVFMSSLNYAKHFKIDFQKSIGLSLGLDSEKLPTDEYMRATFYCESHRNGGVINYEITSALDVSWPDEITTDWLLRKRNNMVNPSTNQTYSWPSNEALTKVRTDDCVILPRYAIQKHKRTHDEELEWEIAFPRTEKQLQLTMTHAQTKTYFFLVLLHRSFIEPCTQYKGILLEHVKMNFYFELEETFVSFPETRMGSKLIEILKTFYSILGQMNLNHYFYGGSKNVLDSIPKDHIATAQTKVHEILNNRVAHFIAALCNLRYTSKHYFPQFDFKTLHKLLTKDHLVVQSDRLKPRKSNFFKKDVKLSNLDTTEKPKEWINLEVPCKVGVNEKIRKIKSLQMFIEHFIGVGKVCLSRSSKELGMLYYQQAKDLTSILEEEGHHDSDVKSYKESIHAGCPDL